jgi:acetyl esterase/lipase
MLVGLPLAAQEKLKLWTDNPTRKEKWSELIAFMPKTPDTTGIGIIICPGGSYYWLDMNNEGFAAAKYLCGHGIAAFVLRYRTARKGNHHPAMIEDLQQAMHIVQKNATKYKINPAKIGLMGFSAGGHLVGMAAMDISSNEYRVSSIKAEESFDTHGLILDTQKVKPYFAAMIYPVVSMTDEAIVHKKSRRNLLGKKYTDKMADMLSLEKHVSSGMPPIFLLHLTGDKTVDYRNSAALDKALTEHGVPHKFMLIEENGHGGHGFGIQPNGKATGWIDEFLKWLLTL